MTRTAFNSRWEHRSSGCGRFADLHRGLEHLTSAGEPVLQIQIHDELVCASLCGRSDIVVDVVPFDLALLGSVADLVRLFGQPLRVLGDVIGFAGHGVRVGRRLP